MRHRWFTAAGRSPRGTPGSSSGFCCSLRSSPPTSRNGDEALAAGTAYVLDSRIPPLEKIGVAREILAAVDDAEAEARVPDVGQIVTERGDEPAYTDLAGSLQDQLDRAATNAFSRSFLAAALLGLAALVPILLDRRDVSL